MSAAAVCARDLAGLWAAMIASTSAADKTKATPDKTTGKAPTPYAAQGFFTTGDHCKPLGAAVESAKDKRLYTLCNEKVLAAPAWLLYGSGTDGWCKPDTSCSKAGKYPPAGPLKLGGVLDTWWFSVHAEGVALAKTPSIAFVPASLPVTNGAIVAGAKAYQYWLSAVFKWMVPIGGRPPPPAVRARADRRRRSGATRGPPWPPPSRSPASRSEPRRKSPRLAATRRTARVPTKSSSPRDSGPRSPPTSTPRTRWPEGASSVVRTPASAGARTPCRPRSSTAEAPTPSAPTRTSPRTRQRRRSPTRSTRTA